MTQVQPKYILTERIAQGGMAEIHLGKLVGSDGFARVCAFKRILPHYAQDREFVEMFRNEANVAKQLQNKNIVQVFDFVSDGNSYMLVMDFVDGQDLRGVLASAEQQKKRIPAELAVYIAMEILAGLSYAHSAVDVSGKSMGIIHRDVSPQNILISYDGDVKLTDFGIAKAENQISNTRVGVLKGKFRYMSPEQASGYNIDARSDIFAVGIILYEMLTMARLFKGDDLVVLESVRNCQIKPPSQANKGIVPPELDEIVMKLLAKDPLHRYQTGREAVRDLSKFLYKHRPDFFIGELADFMQSLFAEKLEAARERLRSTLALPVGNLDTMLKSNNLFGEKIDLSSPSRVIDLSSSMSDSRHQARSGSGASIRVGNAMALGQPAGKRELTLDNSAKLEIKKSPGREFARAASFSLGRKRRSAQSSTGSGSSAVYFEGGKALSPKRNFILPVLVLLVLAGLLFAGLYALRHRNVGLQSQLILSVEPENIRLLVEWNGRAMGKGKPMEFPLQLSLPVGQHTLVLSRPGLKTKRVEVKALSTGGTIQEQVVLERDPTTPTGQLRIMTSPSGAIVTNLDGWDSGKAPYLFKLMPIDQKLRFRLQHPNCKTGIYEEPALSRADTGKILVRKIELRDCTR